MSKYDVSSIETSGFDNESSYGEYSNNYDYNIESIDIDDPEVTHVEFDKPQTKAIEIPDGIDQETTYYSQSEWEGNGGNNFIISSISNFVNNPKQFLVSALATIGNAGVAINAGIGKVAEGLYDALHVAGGVVATPVTGIFDFIGSLTGGDTKATERMWNSTRNVVQKEIVNESLDSYYSQYGKNVNDNAASGFKRGEMGFSVIETGGEVLGTLATGQSLSGSSVLSKSGTNAAVYISGIKGFGQGTEEAWNKGASTFGGITYGAATGSFEAFQWWSGAKINNIQIGNGISGASKYGSIATRVVLDGVDGAIDTPVRSFFDTAYNGKSYGENFNDRGGLQAILQGFFTGSAFSAISEFIQLKMENNVNEKISVDHLTLDDFKYHDDGLVARNADYLQSNLRKYFYTDTTNIPGLNQQIVENGLYHFTSENAADAIINSGYIKSSGYIRSYGQRKTFFFNGIPEIGSYATNLDNIYLKTVAIKIEPNIDLIQGKHLKVRYLDDCAITYDGNFSLQDCSSVSKVYLCLFKENDELVYREVTKQFYDTYQDTEQDKMLQNFIEEKNNVSVIKSDYYISLLTRTTGGTVSSINKLQSIKR